MPLIVKHNRAQHTHENEQFRRVAISLIVLFKEKGWNGLLIGNPYNENYSRFRADAILLYDYGIMIIDFKAYSGTLVLPSNKSKFTAEKWYAETDFDKQRILIKGGNSFINPFRQLDSYRGAFKEIIRGNAQLKRIIQENRTFALNIFSGPLKIVNRIPGEIPYYKITQELDLGDVLYDCASETSYSKEIADSLCVIFNAEDWVVHNKLPDLRKLFNKTVEIEKDVEKSISEFLKTDNSGILVLESMSSNDRDNWVRYILSEAVEFNIPQTEAWIHSARIGRKVGLRMGIELQSLFNTIYGGSAKADISDVSDTEDSQYEENIQDEVPIRRDDNIDKSAVIILHEAHLVSRNKHESELLRFGSGRLLEDLIKFLKLNNSKRKLICIGDPFSLTYGDKITDTSLNVDTLKEFYNGDISHYRQPLKLNMLDGKICLRSNLANSIERKIFNNLEFKWSEDLHKFEENDIEKLLIEWFSKPFTKEPRRAVMKYTNAESQRVNQKIKNICLNNGDNLAKNDLLILNNNVNIPDHTGFSIPTKIYNGMYLLIEEVGETISKSISIKQKNTPVILNFTKLKVKCISFESKLTAEIYMLNNYFESPSKLSGEEEIALRKFVKDCIKEAAVKLPFVKSEEYDRLLKCKEYTLLSPEERKAIVGLSEYYTEHNIIMNSGISTTKEARRKFAEYRKEYENRILRHLRFEDPLINAAYVRYGWCLTVHKCVGTEFAETIIDAFQGENMSTTNDNYFRWLYSGITATSGCVKIVNPPTINPLMSIQYEDTESITADSTSKGVNLLSYPDYKIDDRFLSILKESKNENVNGAICEFTKLIELRGYTLNSIEIKSEYLTKIKFSDTKETNSSFDIVISNKGEKNNWAVSFIRIERSHNVNIEEIEKIIENLFTNATKVDVQKNLDFPNDFRFPIYSKWKEILKNKGYNLALKETHENQDVFEIHKDKSFAKFRLWYNKDNFFKKLSIICKSDNNISDNINKWLINAN